MKRNWIIALLLLVATSLAGQGEKVTAYDIQLGIFASPKSDDFKALQGLGYLYELKQPNGLSKIMLGTFSNPTLTNKRLAEVKKKGFKDAFLVKTDTDESDAVWIVQLATSDLKDPIFWSDWNRLSKDLTVQVWDDRVRVAAGPYRSRGEADENFERIGKEGPKDIFIKKVSRRLIHTVTPFETGGAAAAAKPAAEGVNRRIVADLQKVLALEGFYKGNADGSLGAGTKAALDNFKANSARYQDARRLALGLRSEEETAAVPVAKAGTLQYFVDLIGTNPTDAETGLRGNAHPMAQAYLAYLYLTDLVATPDKFNTVNNLMAKATKSAFKDYKGATRYDYTQRYAYDSPQQFLNHLRDMQMATYDEVAVPCYLFDRHPVEMQRAFAPYWGNAKDNYRVSPGCEQGTEFEELRVLQQLAKAFDPVDAAQKPPTDAAERMADATVVRGIFAAPQVPTFAESQELAEWNRRTLTSLETWASSGVLQRKMVSTYEIAHYEALIKLEYHFLQQGYPTNEAEALALKVIRHSVQGSFKGFVGQ